MAKLTLRVVNRNSAAHRKGLYSSGPVCLVIVCPPRIDTENYKLLIIFRYELSYSEFYVVGDLVSAFQPILILRLLRALCSQVS